MQDNVLVPTVPKAFIEEHGYKANCPGCKSRTRGVANRAHTLRPPMKIFDGRMHLRTIPRAALQHSHLGDVGESWEEDRIQEQQDEQQSKKAKKDDR